MQYAGDLSYGAEGETVKLNKIGEYISILTNDSARRRTTTNHNVDPPCTK
jgi:hypothetical protein